MKKSASSFLLQRRALTLIMKIWTQRTYVLRPVPPIMIMIIIIIVLYPLNEVRCDIFFIRLFLKPEIVNSIGQTYRTIRNNVWNGYGANSDIVYLFAVTVVQIQKQTIQASYWISKANSALPAVQKNYNHRKNTRHKPKQWMQNATRFNYSYRTTRRLDNWHDVWRFHI